MLALIFSRAVKRNVIGLLALGEWGPPTGAPVDVTGTISSDQPRQESLLEGTVEQPSVVVGGGRFVFLEPVASERQEIRGFCHSEQKVQTENLAGQLEFIGDATSLQAAAIDALSGNQESVGACETRQGIQRSELLAHLHFIGRAATEQTAQSDALFASLQFVGEAASEQRIQNDLLPAYLELRGTLLSEQRIQTDVLPAQLELGGEVRSVQESQDGTLLGEMIDVELEMFAALFIEAA